MTGKRALTVGLIGHKFMGKAHSNAWRQAPRFFDLPKHLRLKAICGRDAKVVGEVAGKFVADAMEGRVLLRPGRNRTPRRTSLQPTFEDGLQNQRVLDALARSAHNKRWSEIEV